MFYSLDADPSSLCGRIVALGFNPVSLPSANARRFVRESNPWSPTPIAVIDLVPSVAGTNAYVRLRTSSRWLAVASVLLIAALLAIRWSYQFGPIEAGYGVASSRFFVWPAAALPLAVAAAFFTVVGFLVASRIRVHLQVYLLLRGHVPPN